MNGKKDCRECERQRKIDSWSLSILCGIVSGLVGCGLGLIMYFHII